jgi:3-phosphoshikimate 1-carboxyvinyltransferase
MRASVYRSEVTGKTRAPSSKSYTIRALMCGALAKGESEVVYPLSSGDTEACLEVLGRIGVHSQRGRESWQVMGGDFRQPDADLFCADSAATLRFMTAVCSLVPGECRLVSGASLSARPVGPLVRALRQLGVDCLSHGETAPVVVRGGALRGGLAELPGDMSSQFVSALLLIGPLAEQGVRIRLRSPLQSRPYVLMTTGCLREFGIGVESSEDLDEFQILRQDYRPTRYLVEGDWSSASYLLALGALCGEVEVENLDAGSAQADRAMVHMLRDMGAAVVVKGRSVAVRRSELKAVRADLSECPDLLPTMGILAAVARGVSEFTGIERARIKESNRVAALREGLERMDIEVGEERGKLTIAGGEPSGAAVDSWNDHRIAMAFGVLGSVTDKTVISNAGCVSKSFPQFWDVVNSVGGKVRIDGK